MNDADEGLEDRVFWGEGDVDIEPGPDDGTEDTDEDE